MMIECDSEDIFRVTDRYGNVITIADGLLCVHVESSLSVIATGEGRLHLDQRSNGKVIQTQTMKIPTFKQWRLRFWAWYYSVGR